MLRFCQSATEITAMPQREAEHYTRFGIGVVERDCPTGQCLNRTRNCAYLKVECCLALGSSQGFEAPREIRVEIYGIAKKFLGGGVIRHAVSAEVPQTTLVGCPGIKVFRRLPHSALLFGLGDGRGNSDCRRLGELVLHRKDVREVAIVALGPDMVACLGLD